MCLVPVRAVANGHLKPAQHLIVDPMNPQSFAICIPVVKSCSLIRSLPWQAATTGPNQEGSLVPRSTSRTALLTVFQNGQNPGVTTGSNSHNNPCQGQRWARKRRRLQSPSSPADPHRHLRIGLRLPGGLSTSQELWEFLLAKGDARSRVPESRYNVSAFYSTHAKPGSVGTEHGYFLDDSVNLQSFDASLWNMARQAVERADPQQRQLLEVVRECVEDAGETNWRGKPIGCYVGNFGEDWLEMSAKEGQHHGGYRAAGTGDWMLSNRVSYEMDFRGPR